VGSWELLRFGRATTVNVRRPFDAAKRAAAQASLKYAPVMLNGVQARAIGRGFANYAETAALKVLACAILPQHVHLVVARHRLKVESLVTQLKGDATEQLVAECVHPLAQHRTINGAPPKVFARGMWKAFLNEPAEVRRAISYVERNPLREGLPAQRWGFVSEWEDGLGLAPLRREDSAARRG
jgi:REP element-mobilizing transposase RayT